MLRFSKLWTTIFLFALFLFTNESHAANFTITKSGAEGGKELTQAVFTANTQTSSSHTVRFNSDVHEVILNEELTIRTNITFEGNGACITGAGNFRLFRITNGHTVFNRLTLTNGKTSGNGGAVEIDGTNASAEFKNCTLFKNQAGTYGGAVSITDGSIRDQTTFTHCTIASNIADNGGGISLTNGAAAVYASIVISNGSGDIFGNIQTYDTLTGNSHAAKDIFLTDESEMLELSEVNGSKILKLAQDSPAVDAIESGNSYTLNIDETGTPRPKLFGYDLGAYEAAPVNAEKITISGDKYTQYMQTGTTEKFIAIVTPEDASRNIKDYPPEGITWTVLSTDILSVDNSGTVTALKPGEGYITAILHGWTSDGKEKETRSEPLHVRVGNEARQNIVITLNPINDETMRVNTSQSITPIVTLRVNDYSYVPEIGLNYELHAESLPSGIVDTEISGDTVILTAGNNPGSCDVRVTASALRASSSESQEFHVTVTNKEVGRSSGGGGCASGSLGIYGMLLLIKLCYRRNKNCSIK